MLKEHRRGVGIMGGVEKIIILGRAGASPKPAPVQTPRPSTRAESLEREARLERMAQKPRRRGARACRVPLSGRRGIGRPLQGGCARVVRCTKLDKPARVDPKIIAEK